jgi:prepilin-type N-terminal cleavage/methylation domain-containing protein
MKNSKKNKQGLTLLEILMALGLFSVIALALSQVTTYSLKSSKGFAISADASQFQSHVIALLRNQSNCTQMLQGVTVSTQAAPITLKDPLNQLLIHPAGTNLRFSASGPSLSLDHRVGQPTAVGTQNAIVVLNLGLDNVAAQDKRVLGAQTFPMTLSLGVQLSPTSVINECSPPASTSTFNMSLPACSSAGDTDPKTGKRSYCPPGCYLTNDNPGYNSSTLNVLKSCSEPESMLITKNAAGIVIGYSVGGVFGATFGALWANGVFDKLFGTECWGKITWYKYTYPASAHTYQCTPISH